MQRIAATAVTTATAMLPWSPNADTVKPTEPTTISSVKNASVARR